MNTPSQEPDGVPASPAAHALHHPEKRLDPLAIAVGFYGESNGETAITRRDLIDRLSASTEKPPIEQSQGEIHSAINAATVETLARELFEESFFERIKELEDPTLTDEERNAKIAQYLKEPSFMVLLDWFLSAHIVPDSPGAQKN